MGPNRVFFSQEALDQWLAEGSVDLADNRLTIVSEERSYKVVEAVHVLYEVTGSPDPYELSGKVKTVAYLTELGAELLETSMVIGDNAYDVIPGWMGAPIAPSQAAGSGVRSAVSNTDEELLAQFLMRNL